MNGPSCLHPSTSWCQTNRFKLRDVVWRVKIDTEDLIFCSKAFHFNTLSVCGLGIGVKFDTPFWYPHTTYSLFLNRAVMRKLPIFSLLPLSVTVVKGALPWRTTGVDLHLHCDLWNKLNQSVIIHDGVNLFRMWAVGCGWGIGEASTRQNMTESWAVRLCFVHNSWQNNMLNRPYPLMQQTSSQIFQMEGWRFDNGIETDLVMDEDENGKITKSSKNWSASAKST